MRSGVQMIGVTKKQIRKTLDTIGGTSRNRAETMPKSSATQSPVRHRSTRPGRARSPFQPGHTPKTIATTTKTTALCRRVSRLRQSSRYTWTESGRPTCLMMLSEAMNALQPSRMMSDISVQTMKPSARNGMYSAMSASNSTP